MFSCLLSNAQPSNDNCKNAREVSCSDTSYVTVKGNLFAATPSGASVPKCDPREPNNAQDIWFTFVATNTRHQIMASPCALCFTVDLDFVLYEGTCDNLIKLDCATDIFQYFAESEIYDNLKIGTQYYVRVYEYNQNNNINANDITFGVRIPPTNSNSIDEIMEDNHISIAPNPFNEKLMIQVNNAILDENASFQIFNITGQLVYSNKLNTSTIAIETNNWPSGLYIYKYQIQNANYSGKIVKQ